MHGHDPVHWLEWQQETLKKAQSENKIIMISSGYFSCHWCHVMQKENYQNTETADFLNHYFVSVKIDRELSPDLDRYLINFSEKTAGYAGWPLHVFLTPDGYPFYAFTYKPAPDFLNTLKRIISLWKKSPEDISKAAMKAIPKQTPFIEVPFTLSPDTFYSALESEVMHQQDKLSGGLKGSNKFPMAPLLKAMLEIPELSEENQEWLLLTLDQMQSEHLIDHVNGGFYRYTVDPEWQTPHFEKMLYTQALLANIYYLAGRKFNRHDYVATADETLSYAQKHLFNQQTGLYQSSQSAIDQHNLEGGDYLWTQTQLKKILPKEDFHLIKTEWRLNMPAPYELNGEPAWHPKPTSKNWRQIKQKLKAPPQNIPTDSKSILGWNGLMLSALAESQQVKPSQSNQKKGENLAHHLLSLLNDDSPPRALSKNGEKMGRANLQDYAFILQGLRDWQKVSPSEKLTESISQLNQKTRKKFLTTNGWLYSDSPLLPGQTGEWILEDDATPSPTAILDCGNPDHLGNIQALLLKYPISAASYGQNFYCR